MERTILVTGATGYVGSKLIPLLLEKGQRVRVLARDPDRLLGHSWAAQVEVFRGDLLQEDSLSPALETVDAAYYLVHNMSSGLHYETREAESARNFAAAAEQACLRQIIYLGGLAHPEEKISSHMLSRLHTGEILRACQVPVTEFRASLIIGAGSISFEMIRYLAEQLPLMVGPQNLKKLAQPIAVTDVLVYLLAALDTPACLGGIYEIGGMDVLTYQEVMQVYARVRGLKRSLLVLPWMPLDLMALIAGILTPVPAKIARPLLGGMKSSSDVRSAAVETVFPDIHPKTYLESVLRALDDLTPARLEFCWTPDTPLTRIRQNGFFVDRRECKIDARPAAVFDVISGMGGRNGWPYLDGLWKLRGILDKLVGGPGLRGRKDAKSLNENDIVDYYRVEALEPGRRLLLKAELKSPGDGWMEWRVTPDGLGTKLTQTVFYAPRGLAGYIYWYALWPVHTTVFTGLTRAITRGAK